MSKKSKTVRLKLILTYEYDADPEDYGTSNPKKMAEIDWNPNHDQCYSLAEAVSFAFCENMGLDYHDENNGLQIKVKPVKKK